MLKRLRYHWRQSLRMVSLVSCSLLSLSVSWAAGNEAAKTTKQDSTKQATTTSSASNPSAANNASSAKSSDNNSSSANSAENTTSSTNIADNSTSTNSSNDSANSSENSTNSNSSTSSDTNANPTPQLVDLNQLSKGKKYYITTPAHNWGSDYILNAIGRESGNVEQAFTILPTTKDLVSQRVCSYHKACLTSFSLAEYMYVITGYAFSNPTDVIGHQGLTHEYTSQNTYYLWTSAGPAVAGYGRYAIRLAYPFEKTIKNYQKIKLFDGEFASVGSVTPTISSDYRYLIARGYKGANKVPTLRVWNLKDLKLESTVVIDPNTNLVVTKTPNPDVSRKYLYEFALDPLSQYEEYPLQGIASDGNYIYALLGKSDINHDKVLLTYTITGTLVGREFLTVGKDIALTLMPQQHWEAEGMTIYQNRMYITIVTGFAKLRTNMIYSRSLKDQVASLYHYELGVNPLSHLHKDTDPSDSEDN
ncbi:hypothetical protein [Psittacicella hinzii]|nr:hypothetical protein [Psittacicella hinzii]